MVRQYKWTREVLSADRLQSAHAAIKNNNMAIRAAAKAFKVDRMTLKRFMDRDGVTGQKNKYCYTPSIFRGPRVRAH